MAASAHIAPRAAMIAADFVRVLATESIATPMVEGARTRTRAKDRRGRGQRGSSTASETRTMKDAD